MSNKRKKKNVGCWLFLDCKLMTGELPENCPNYKSCKHNALHTQNRCCFLPCKMWLPDRDQLYKVPTLEVLQWIPSEAKEAGYGTAIDIFYSYHNSCLVIGKDEYGFSLDIPEEARALGFAESEKIPYEYRQLREYGKLDVTDDSHRFRGLGWHVAIFLPYRFHHDLDTGKLFIKVEFDYIKWEYKEVIALGWYPPCNWYPRPQKTPSNVLTQNSSHLDSEQNDLDDDIPF